MHKETMKVNEAKPLPCPFCGAEPEVYAFTTHMEFIVECLNEDCAMRPHTHIRDTRERAIADWNVRAGR